MFEELPQHSDVFLNHCISLKTIGNISKATSRTCLTATVLNINAIIQVPTWALTAHELSSVGCSLYGASSGSINPGGEDSVVLWQTPVKKVEQQPWPHLCN